MNRKIDEILLNWRNDTSRKVLLVRGARQVGKTYSIRKLGKTFKYFIEVNFEEEADIKSFFKSSLNPSEICEKLTAFYNKPIIPGKTFLFFLWD